MSNPLVSDNVDESIAECRYSIVGREGREGWKEGESTYAHFLDLWGSILHW